MFLLLFSLKGYKHTDQSEFAAVLQDKPRQRYMNKSASPPTLVTSTTRENSRFSTRSGNEEKVKYSSSNVHPSIGTFVRGNGGPPTQSKDPSVTVKWTSQTFPSFMVSSVNGSSLDSQKARASIGNTRSLQGLHHRKSNGAERASPFQDTGMESKSMPLISASSNDLATKSEFRHLLRHSTQVSFQNSRPGFRYETLCLQGRNATITDSFPNRVVGPWITTQ